MGFFSKLVGSITGSDKAAKAASGRLNDQLGFLQNIYDKQTEAYQPYADVGGEGLGILKDILFGGDMSKFYTSPGYQFRLDEGNRSIKNMLSSGGLRNSTAALRNASEYGQNLATQEYQNFLNNIFGLTNAGTAGLDAQSAIMQNLAGLRGGTIQQLANVEAAKAKAPFNDIISSIGAISGLGGFWGGSSSPSSSNIQDKE